MMCTRRLARAEQQAPTLIAAGLLPALLQAQASDATKRAGSYLLLSAL